MICCCLLVSSRFFRVVVVDHEGVGVYMYIAGVLFLIPRALITPLLTVAPVPRLVTVTGLARMVGPR